jgi:hypothetical protein
MEPLPPVKEVEYRCIIGKIFEELSGSEYITFAFETAKEFSNFRYEIAVRYRIQPGSLEFKVLGMTATRTMMPAFGTARSVLKLPLLPFGVYTVKMVKSDGIENVFSIEVTKRGLQILPPVPRKRFIDLVIERSASAPGARITSTVTKTPPPPLVPRTIQKRQPTPPTPEELALLESLRSETPEERDQREEMELFGGKKKVDKKELEDAEHDLKKLGDTPGIAGSSKSGAKRSLEEVKEVPANVKPVPPVKAHAKPKPAPAKPVKKLKAAPAKSSHKAAKTKVKLVAKTKTVAKAVSKSTAKPVKARTTKPVAKSSASKKPVKSAQVKAGKAKTTKHAASKKAVKRR